MLSSPLRGRARLAGAVLAALLPLALVACGGGGSSAATTTGSASSTEAITTAAPPTTAGVSPSTAPSTTLAPTTTRPPGPLASSLLVPADVGDGFLATRAPLDPSGETTPCGTPTVGTAVPPLARDGVDISKLLENLLLSQTVYQYADAADAQQAMAAAEAGLSCGKGTSTEQDGTSTTFDLTKLNGAVGLGDESYAYTGSVVNGSRSVRASFVAMRVGRALSTITFLAEPNVQGPAADPILAIAVQKLGTIA